MIPERFKAIPVLRKPINAAMLSERSIEPKQERPVCPTNRLRCQFHSLAGGLRYPRDTTFARGRLRRLLSLSSPSEQVTFTLTLADRVSKLRHEATFAIDIAY